MAPVLCLEDVMGVEVDFSPLLMVADLPTPFWPPLADGAEDSLLELAVIAIMENFGHLREMIKSIMLALARAGLRNSLIRRPGML